MRYASAGAFRRALDTRLAAQARDSGRSVVRLRKEVAFDRLLARLFSVAPERWVLKGALALDYRFGDRARTTKDIDLATAGDETSAMADLLAVQSVDLGDFFAFAIERTSALDRLVEGAAVRYHVRAELAGRVFDEFLLDVGFDPPRDVELDRLRGPDLLAFAEITPVELPAVPIEVHVAEKLHAYSRVYGMGSLGSTRVKDLIDLALIAAEASLDAARLRAAIGSTFGRRASHELPERLPRPPADWRVAYGRMARSIGLDADLDAGFDLAARLLDPVLGRTVQRGAWDPDAETWTSPPDPTRSGRPGNGS
ncbi:MAG: nucleotidyl transferase AbiEii/AbiGii toxin family protein [Chloroflexi bacterium]|nr:nucleotidyl transferase AbiEii/AbiGii toxin family protein [Chloroflexota bacterium]